MDFEAINNSTRINQSKIGEQEEDDNMRSQSIIGTNFGLEAMINLGDGEDLGGMLG